MTDLQKFISKSQPSKFKELKNGIEVRSVQDVKEGVNKARELIISLGLGLVVVDTAEMAERRCYGVEIIKG